MKKESEIKNEYDYHRYWKDMYEKEHKLRHEAEGETTIVKGIGMNSPEMKEAKQRIKALDKSITGLIDISDSKQKEITKLNLRITELENEKEKSNIR